MNSIIYKNKKIRPFYWILLLFLQPGFLYYQNSLEILYDLWNYVQLIVMFILLLEYVFYYKFSCRLINYIFIYYVWICISCFMNGYTLISIIWEIVPDIGISLFVYKAMRLSKQNYINIAFKIITIYIIINFLTMILFPEGIASGRIGQTMWFLGGKNVILPYILLGISMVIIRSYSSKRHNTIGTYFYISILSILALFTDSSTIILIVILLMVGVIIEILIKRKLIEKIFSGRNLLVLVVAIFLFVVFFSTNKNIVKIITTWLGKDVTFNGRTALWTLCLSMIKLHPIIGSGPSLVLDVGWGVTMTHAHDLYLNIATKYGLPAFVMLLMILIHTFRNSKDSKMPLAWYALALYLVGSVVEVYSTNTLFLFCMTLSQCGIKKDNFAIKCSQLQ